MRRDERSEEAEIAQHLLVHEQDDLRFHLRADLKADRSDGRAVVGRVVVLDYQRLARDMSDKPVMILRNHGTLVAGETAGQAFSMMWHLEKAMQAQADALASGEKLTTPSKRVALQIAQRGFSKAKIAQYSDGASPLARLEWPGLLRMLDRIDPSYRD